jgi:CubicO group peptidase (beta-lactamase class C family)
MHMDREASRDQARHTLEGLVAARRVPGIQYAVVDAEGICFEFNGGLADIGARLPVTAQTTFMAASSTKVITAAAVLQLVQQGKVALDAALSDYYPHHPYGDQVTVRRLLNQSAGIPNPLPLRWLHPVEAHASFDEEAALQAALRRAPKPAFAPGSKYGYSNLSYWLLGKVVEQASGEPYCAYLRGHLFAPLGIAPVELDCVLPDLAHHAAGYQKKYSLLGLFLYLMMDRRLLAGSEAGRFKLKPVYMNVLPMAVSMRRRVGWRAFSKTNCAPRRGCSTCLRAPSSSPPNRTTRAATWVRRWAGTAAR